MPRAAAIQFDAITSQQVAEAFGVTPQALQNWKALIGDSGEIWHLIDGRGAAGKSVRWNLPKLIEWREAKGIEDALRKRPPAALDALDQERLRKAKLANDETEGRLVDRLQMERQWARIGHDLRVRLETIGRRHGKPVANDIAKAMEDLKRQIHGVLGESAA